MRNTGRARALLLVLAGWSAEAGAQDATAPARPASAAVVELETMVVRGSQPGPGLWKVSRGEHVLWILGTVAPLPAGIAWQSGEVEATIAQSQQVLQPPGLTFDADVGLFGKLMLAPSAFKAMKNEDGAELRDVLPAETYAQWLRLKARYLGRDRGIERKRPMLAAGELYEAAVRKSGLARKPLVWPVVERAAKRAGIAPTSTTLEFKIEDPKAAIRQFRAGGMDDVACLRTVMAAVEHDLPSMVARANAWAVGDVDALQAMPRQDPRRACTQALSASGFARERGYGDLDARMRQHWLEIAGRALQANRSTFAVLPVSDLLGGSGYLARLQALGYVVEAP